MEMVKRKGRTLVVSLVLAFYFLFVIVVVGILTSCRRFSYTLWLCCCYFPQKIFCFSFFCLKNNNNCMYIYSPEYCLCCCRFSSFCVPLIFVVILLIFFQHFHKGYYVYMTPGTWCGFSIWIIIIIIINMYVFQMCFQGNCLTSDGCLCI